MDKGNGDMKRRLTTREYIYVASMLFGLFFGAGNLIFPAYMGQAAGRSLVPALIGFLITGVGIPLLSITALAVTRTGGLLQLSRKVGRRYSYCLTCIVYLTIGPFFAIPRCFTVPFESGISALIPEGVSRRLALFIFSLVFFAIMLYFSLRRGKILFWIGKLLNPIFLTIFAVLLIAALSKPMGNIALVAPVEEYASAPFAKGFLEGYNTMDAIAGLCFGIIVVNVIHSLGVEDPSDVAVCTVKSGALSCLLMAVLYSATTLSGAFSRGVFPLQENGGAVLSQIARYYFSSAGAYILALIIFFATIKTAIGLITSCSEAFVDMFPNLPGYRFWAVLFSLWSLAMANLGLSDIIRFSIPVLMFIYPLAITLIFLALFEKPLGLRRISFVLVTAVTAVCAFGDLCAALPQELRDAAGMNGIVDLYSKGLPLFGYGLGWLVPALIALAISIPAGRSAGTDHSGRGA